MACYAQLILLWEMLMGLFKQAWQGEAKLWKVFWLYGFLLPIAIFAPINVLVTFAPALKPLEVTLSVIFMIWWFVAVWRCAYNVQWRPWAIIVRVGVPLSFVILPMLLGIVMVGGDLIDAAQCRKELKEYIAHGGTDPDGFKRQCHIRQQLASHGQFDRDIPADKKEYFLQCMQAMTKAAQEEGAKPADYIAQNQEYFNQCMSYYENAATQQ